MANYTRIFNLHFSVDLLIAEFYFPHWLSLIGGLYIAFTIPIYYVMKRRRPKMYSSLLKMHIFGNLSAFLLVSIHFSQQMGRPAEFFPELGTGLVLYISMILLVVTGFLQRFPLTGGSVKRWKYLHTCVTVTFYLVIIVHVLHNLGII
ncbi:MAG: hypothetical protein ACOC6G_00475 [Thermoproteota archaeon]